MKNWCVGTDPFCLSQRGDESGCKRSRDERYSEKTESGSMSQYCFCLMMIVFPLKNWSALCPGW